MRCYFLRDGHIAGVEILPAGISDEEAIAKAHAAVLKRKGLFESLEVWEGSRFVYRAPIASNEASATEARPPPEADENSPDLIRPPPV